MNIERFFYEHPVFHHDEFTNYKLHHGNTKPGSVNTALSYYTKQGRIKLIRRKLYAVIPPNESAESLSVDPYLIAGKVTDDSVIAYHSALELMGAAYSIFGQLSYITGKKSKPFEYGGQWFQSVAVPKVLKDKQASDLFVDTINRQGLDIRVTNPARTFVDVLDRVEYCGGWEEVCRSISSLALLNVEQVIRYCLMLENSRLSAKVGYFLSLRQDAFSVSEKELEPLQATKPKVPQCVNGTPKDKFQLIKEWNIYLPESVINQSWEEKDVEF
jgi:predicted transcriptional regulator of viral defense system